MLLLLCVAQLALKLINSVFQNEPLEEQIPTISIFNIRDTLSIYVNGFVEGKLLFMFLLRM